VPCPDETAFAKALTAVCAELAQDVVRNGEGVRHVLRTTVTGAPSETLARALGKAIINAPLVKCAICGNDPNVGRILMAIGKHVGIHAPDLGLDKLALSLGGHAIYRDGAFTLDSALERRLVEHLKHAELYASVVPADGIFRPAVDFPPHERCVELDVDLGQGTSSATVYGADLTHEYVSENADYRS